MMKDLTRSPESNAHANRALNALLLGYESNFSVVGQELEVNMVAATNYHTRTFSRGLG